MSAGADERAARDALYARTGRVYTSLTPSAADLPLMRRAIELSALASPRFGCVIASADGAKWG